MTSMYMFGQFNFLSSYVYYFKPLDNVRFVCEPRQAFSMLAFSMHLSQITMHLFYIQVYWI